MDQLQYLMYAERKHSLLIVLKDSMPVARTASSVTFSAARPRGLRRPDESSWPSCRPSRPFRDVTNLAWFESVEARNAKRFSQRGLASLGHGRNVRRRVGTESHKTEAGNLDRGKQHGSNQRKKGMILRFFWGSLSYLLIGDVVARSWVGAKALFPCPITRAYNELNS
jgi:hypothetical protein